MTTGDRIREARIAKGLNQEELAKKLGYKSKSTISKIESDDRDIPRSEILKFAEVLDTTPQYLVGWEDLQGSKPYRLFNVEQNIFDLIKQKNIPVLQFCKDVGISEKAYYDWKNGASFSYLYMLEKLAAYFEVDVHDLVDDLGESSIEDYVKKSNKQIEETRRMDALIMGTPVPKPPAEPPITLVAAPKGKTRMLPLYESVSAGFGTYADSQIKDYVPFNIESDAEAEESIAIIVKGNSMSPQIEDGDIIQVHCQDYIEDGDIAVVLVGDEGRVKQIRRGKNWIELVSFNSEYPPQRFVKEEMNDIRIFGKVQGFYRNF